MNYIRLLCEFEKESVLSYISPNSEKCEIELIETQHSLPISPVFVDSDGKRKRWVQSVDEAHYRFVKKEHNNG